jgi:small subunit ribosomal protein S9
MSEEKQENLLPDNTDEAPKFKGRFVEAVGRRKTATAQVRLYANGKGVIVVNGMSIKKYFSVDQTQLLIQSLKLTGHLRDFDISALTNGGGKKSQAEAIRLGISRALVAFEKELKPALRPKGFLTRDPRKKERKKPGLKRARRAPQWSKR